MSIFLPHIDNMPAPVRAICPACGAAIQSSDYTDEEKWFLLNATTYHEVNEEYGHLKTLDTLLGRFPGTSNPLVLSKTKALGRGKDDDLAVREIFETNPGFEDFLKNCDFLFSARYPFVQSLVKRLERSIRTRRVTCETCDSQYMVLPFDYHMLCG